MRILTLALMLALILGSSAMAEFNLDSLLIKSVGGPEAVQAIENARSFRAEGKLDFNGMPGVYTTTLVPPDKYVTEIDLGALKIRQGFDGAIAWQTNPNGSVSILSGYERRELLKSLYFESFSYLIPDRLPGDIAYNGLTTRRDTAYHEVVFYPLGQDTVRVLFDVATGRQRFVESEVDNLQTNTSIEGYRKFGGIVFPTRTVLTGVGAPLAISMQIDTVVIDEPTELSIFDYPESSGDRLHFPEGKDSVVVAVKYLNGHIYVLATVDGAEPRWFILDSGTSAVILDRAWADSLPLEKSGTMVAKGMGGYEDVSLLRIDSLKIGELTLVDHICGTLELSTIGFTPPTGHPFGGILGHDFLAELPMMLDYRAGRLIVYTPETAPSPVSGAELPCRFTSGVPTVTATLDGVSGDFLVDLGNPFGVIVHQQFAREHHLNDILLDVRDFEGGLGGIGGSALGQSGMAQQLNFGSFALDSIRVLLPETTSGLAGSEEIAGNIGNLVLQNFRLFLDYANNRLVFYPHES
jgi:hypothetical protein